MPPAVDVVRDGGEARAKGSYPSGTGIMRSSNERRPSSGSPWSVNLSFFAHRGNNCGQSRILLSGHIVGHSDRNLLFRSSFRPRLDPRTLCPA